MTAKFTYAIASRGRSRTIASDSLAVVCGAGVPVAIFVNDEAEAAEYRAAVSAFDLVSVVSTGTSGITNARNAMLDHFGLGAKIVMLCDDVRAIQCIEDVHGLAGKRAMRSLGAREIRSFCEWAFAESEKAGASLWGVFPVANRLSMNRRVTRRAFVIASFCGVVVSRIRYDAAIRIKEDYDFTLAHIVANAMIRFNWVCVHAKHYTNAGGVVDTRTAAVEREAIAKLAAKYPGMIRANTKRANEILIKAAK